MRNKYEDSLDAKNLKRNAPNPSGKIIHFKLVEGTVFIPQGTWHYEDDCSDGGWIGCGTPDNH